MIHLLERLCDLRIEFGAHLSHKLWVHGLKQRAVAALANARGNLIANTQCSAIAFPVVGILATSTVLQHFELALIRMMPLHELNGSDALPSANRAGQVVCSNPRLDSDGVASLLLQDASNLRDGEGLAHLALSILSFD